jgi:WD40 repeat protein
MLASGGEDKNIIFWDVKTGKIITTLKRHTNGVVNVSFSPNASGLLASGSADKKVILWNYQEILSKFTLDDLLARGCDRVRDYLQNNPTVSDSDRALCVGITPLPKQQPEISSSTIDPVPTLSIPDGIPKLWRME